MERERQVQRAARGGRRRGLNPKSKRQKREKIVHRYGPANEGLPYYGVIVQWGRKTKYTTRNLLIELKPKQLAAIGTAPEEANAEANEIEVEAFKPNKTKGLKRKECPFVRRVGPNKAMVMFKDWNHANRFADAEEPDFQTLIPVSFISTIGVAMFNKAYFKDITESVIRNILPDGFEMLHWRRNLKNDKVQLTIAVRGSKIPDHLTFKGDTSPFVLFERKPVFCTCCLRYGHRLINCMHKPRCGVCSANTMENPHVEKECPNANSPKCLYCQEDHTIGTKDCIEHTQQCKFKMMLVKHKMDYFTVVEKAILPAIRTTPVNSNRYWEFDYMD